MTVCIGVLCQNNQAAVLVADRMITSGLSIQFEHPVRNKVTPLSNGCSALTAGNALAFTELFNDVRRETYNLKSTSVEEFVEVIKESYQKLRKRQIIERTLMPRGFRHFNEFYQAQAAGLSETVAYAILGEMERFNYGLDVLVGGMGPTGAHLYVIDDPGTSHCIDSVGFHAIGSGMNLAMSSLIANQCHQELNVGEALLIALQAKVTAENAPGVGNRTDVSIIISHKGQDLTVPLGDEHIKQLREVCKKRADGKGGNCIAEANAIILAASGAANAASGVSNGHHADTIQQPINGENGNATHQETKDAVPAESASPAVASADAPADQSGNGEG